MSERIRTVPPSGQLTVVVQLEVANASPTTAHTGVVVIYAGSRRGDPTRVSVPANGQTALFLVQPFRDLPPGPIQLDVTVTSEVTDSLTLVTAEIVS